MDHIHPSLTDQLQLALRGAEARFREIEGYDPDRRMKDQIAIRCSQNALAITCHSITTKIFEIEDSTQQAEGEEVIKRILEATRKCDLSGNVSDSVVVNSLQQLLKDLCEPTDDEKFWLIVPGSGQLSREASERFTEIRDFFVKNVTEAA